MTGFLCFPEDSAWKMSSDKGTAHTCGDRWDGISIIHLDACRSLAACSLVVCFRLHMHPTRTHNSAQTSQIKAFPLNPPPSIPTFIKPWYGLKLGWLFALSSTKLTLIICGWTCVFVDWGWGVEFFSIWEQGNEAVDGELRKECNKYEGNTHSWFKVGHIGWLKDEPCLSKFLHLKIKHRQTDRQMMKLHVSVLNGETSVFDVYNCFIAI